MDNSHTSNNKPQFNIIDTDIPKEILENFSNDVLIHLFNYIPKISALELNAEYKAVLTSKKINIVHYMSTKFKWDDIYDIDCIGVKIKEMTPAIKQNVSQLLTVDDKYYKSAYVYISTPNSIYAAYLLGIFGKKNVIMAEKFNAVHDLIKSNYTKLSSMITDTSEQINVANTTVKTVSTDLSKQVNDVKAEHSSKNRWIK